MPRESTIEEIEQESTRKRGSWGSRRSRSTGTAASGPSRSAPRWSARVRERDSHPAPRDPTRMRLPDERTSITHKFQIGSHEGYVTVGLYEDGRPGEIFIVMAKEGKRRFRPRRSLRDVRLDRASVRGAAQGAGGQVHPHPLRAPPESPTHPDIRFAKSITDYIFRWLALKFLPSEEGMPTAKDLTPGAAPAAPRRGGGADRLRHHRVGRRLR